MKDQTTVEPAIENASPAQRLAMTKYRESWMTWLDAPDESECKKAAEVVLDSLQSSIASSAIDPIWDAFTHTLPHFHKRRGT